MPHQPVYHPGDEFLGDILNRTGLDLDSLLVIRHTYKTDGLKNPYDVTEEKVRAYTSQQGHKTFPAAPPPNWLVFVKDGSLESRFFGAYENRGVRDTNTKHRHFDLQPSALLSDLRMRLVIEWSGARSWYRWGAKAAKFPILEIADPADFPSHRSAGTTPAPRR